jgi:transcriptional regulator with XRE-family HTH domain
MIKRRRDELGETQEEFAARVGQSLRTITAWEAGDSRPRKTTELDKLGPPKPLLTSHARERTPLEEIDLAAAKVSDLVAHLLDVATELSRRLPNNTPNFAGFEEVERPNLRGHPGQIPADAVAFDNSFPIEPEPDDPGEERLNGRTSS